MHDRYPLLLAPLDLGALRLRNRVVMGSMHTRLEEAPGGMERLAAFYAERARGGVAMIVTGGVSPNAAGRLDETGATLSTEADARAHRPVTAAVHAEGAAIVLQLLHAGRYAAQAGLVAPSAIRAPHSQHEPRALGHGEILETIEDYARAAALAREAGYDGVEIMGSEGYLLNEFVAPRTNQRTDDWGGSLDGRLRFPVEVVRRVRERVGRDFLVLFRLSAVDLVPDGSTGADVVALARAVERAGASVLDTGIGWHEARVPTIAACVPPAAFAWAAGRLRREVRIPVMAVNRIATPEAAEEVLRSGQADLVSLARPLLADPELVRKAAEGRSDEIVRCVACNQGCLDHIFEGRRCSCTVNPRACRETELRVESAWTRKRIAVIGGGPAGSVCAATLAERGYAVTLYEKDTAVGGQLALAARIPGKADWAETVRGLDRRLARAGVARSVGRAPSARELADARLDEVVVATGTRPRRLDIPGADGPRVLTYVDVAAGAPVGDRVAILGAGAMGFDILELLAESPLELDRDRFLDEWGIDPTLAAAGGLLSTAVPRLRRPRRTITLLQRRAEKPGLGLGRTTGWIHRARAQALGVTQIPGVTYRSIDEKGLHVEAAGRSVTLEVDNVVVCAGQEPDRALFDALVALGVRAHLVGGARVAAEMDAKAAICDGTELGLGL